MSIDSYKLTIQSWNISKPEEWYLVFVIFAICFSDQPEIVVFLNHVIILPHILIWNGIANEKYDYIIKWWIVNDN